jgi:predicted RNase H-like HicB family nuclease
MTTWTVVYEHASTSWGAYVPALPGLGVVGDSREEVEQLIREAIPFHLEGLLEDGEPTPDPETIEVATVSV